MGVEIKNCFAAFCGDGSVSGLALIRLRNPEGDDPIYDRSRNVWLPCNYTIRADIDPETGCWQTCEIPCNSDLSPCGTYYEIVEIINGKGCKPKYFQLDCCKYEYPTPTLLADVLIEKPLHVPSQPQRPTLKPHAACGCAPAAKPCQHAAAPIEPHMLAPFPTARPDCGCYHSGSACGRCEATPAPPVGDTGCDAPVVIEPCDSDWYEWTVCGCGTCAEPLRVGLKLKAEGLISGDAGNTLIVGDDGLLYNGAAN